MIHTRIKQKSDAYEVHRIIQEKCKYSGDMRNTITIMITVMIIILMTCRKQRREAPGKKQ